MRYHAPVDPYCPELSEKLEALHNDPMTAYSGVGDEIQESIERKHRQDCTRCQEYGAANIEVI